MCLDGSQAVVAAGADGGSVGAVYRFDQVPLVTSVTPGVGPLLGGNTVTVSGEAFTPGTTVFFRGKPAASVTFLDSSTLEVEVPPLSGGLFPEARTVLGLVPGGGANPVNVRVTNTCGSDFLFAGYRYVPSLH